MASKKRISYQWRLFLPSTICLWLVIFGIFKWQEIRIREVRDEMAFDQLMMLGTRMANTYDTNVTDVPSEFAEFVNRFYDESENYDPVNVLVQDINTGKIVERYGNNISKNFEELPKGKSGRIVIDKEYLNDGFDEDLTFLFSTHVAPKEKKRIYVMLPYTKRLQEITDTRSTYFWLIFIALGIVVTIINYISASYFNRNLKILKKFAVQASTNPNLVIRDNMTFPHDELGDISHEILKIYNQRTEEIERREREHKVALNAIEEKERIKRELTGNINHELKTPVGVIQGYIDTIVETPNLSPEMRDKFLLKAQQSVHRLSSLINDITAITKLESGGKLVNISDINFHDLTFSFDNYIKESNVLQDKMSFSYHMPLNVMILGNEQLLTTVLLNFVKNSVAYSEGTECHLILDSEDDDFFYFKYWDNGIGVPPEHLPHMFERFYRVNAGRSRNSGGTGLGLAIVEVTIESFGGKIEVLNHFPTGLEYRFSLPKYKKPNKKKATDSDENTSDENTPDTKDKT